MKTQYRKLLVKVGAVKEKIHRFFNWNIMLKVKINFENLAPCQFKTKLMRKIKRL